MIPIGSRASSAKRGLEEGIVGAGFSRPTRALVMELVDGSTLADRITEGPISVDEALPIARQIAEALEAAHERGVIHRDLKPANIKLTPSGQVKVLDFGLAKLAEASGAGAGAAAARDFSISPTLTVQATIAGVILGTAAYMSPNCRSQCRLTVGKSPSWRQLTVCPVCGYVHWPRQPRSPSQARKGLCTLSGHRIASR
jgi:serine/threonine protein kinase